MLLLKVAKHKYEIDFHNAAHGVVLLDIANKRVIYNSYQALLDQKLPAACKQYATSLYKTISLRSRFLCINVTCFKKVSYLNSINNDLL